MTIENYLAVLKNINFTKLWISQATSQLTNYILSFAILIKVFQLTHSSTDVALIIMAFGLGTIFFGSTAGVYADRFDRKWLLTIINFLQAGSIALYFIVGGDFWGLFIITFAYSSLNQFYIPAEAPSIPNLVSSKEILVANSYFAFTNSAALIIGFASAGPLSSAFGQAAPFIAGTILLLIAGFATLTLPSIKPEKIVKNPYAFKKIWSEFKEGIIHFWQNKILHYPLLSLLSIQVVNGMLITIAPVFMQNALGINLQTGSILVVAPLGVGILIGALSLGAEEKKFQKQQLIFVGFIGMGIAIALLSLINHISFLAFDESLHSGKYLYYTILAFVIGFFNAHIFAPSHSLLQTYSHSQMRGRVYGSLYFLLQVAATLPTIIIGLLADKVALSYIVFGLGLILLIFGYSITQLDKNSKLSKI
jgi:MFS family permease